MMNERRFPRGFNVFDPIGSARLVSSEVPVPHHHHDPLESFIAEMMASMAECAQADDAIVSSSESQMRTAA